MPAKTVAVVTLSTTVVQFYAKQLHALFGELIQIVPYSFEDGSAYRIEPADLIIVSSSAAENYQAARQWLPPGSLSILSNITITRSALEQLMDLPQGTKALLVNLSLKMAMEVISDLHHQVFMIIPCCTRIFTAGGMDRCRPRTCRKQNKYR